nr:lytic transglycosylase domain-containing protein [Spirochaetota bacterium]
GITPSLLIALMKVESRFNNYAINYNTNRSIDRGLCQLNSSVFVNLKPEEFFNPDINIANGANHLRWCLDKADNKLTKALAMYNAGYGKVSNTKVGAITLDYIQKIIDEKNIIDEKLENYILEYSDLLK